MSFPIPRRRFHKYSGETEQKSFFDKVMAVLNAKSDYRMLITVDETTMTAVLEGLFSRKIPGSIIHWLSPELSTTCQDASPQNFKGREPCGVDTAMQLSGLLSQNSEDRS